MSEALYHPLSEIVRRAAQRKITEDPREAKIKARLDDASDEVVLLIDTSGSMNDPIGDMAMHKSEHAQVALDDLLANYPKIRVFAFGSRCVEILNGKLPWPAGGTDMAGALKSIAHIRPRKTVIISDGMPDNADRAKEAAEKLTGVIDTIYCGPDGHPAISFLRSLCRLSGGVHVTWEGRHTLTGPVRALIGAPQP